MSRTVSRRHFLCATVTLFFSSGCLQRVPTLSEAPSMNKLLEEVERSFDGRLGVFALNGANGALLAYRADERFPVCSTFKIFAAAAILKKSEQDTELMQRIVRYASSDLVSYSPITESHCAEGMTVTELCAAAMQYSDNTASNLLLHILGGPEAVTAFARSIGDNTFRLDRWETDLNSAIPDDPRDTSTPRAMGTSLHQLLLGTVLRREHQEQLKTWLLGNTTGGTRIKAGIPSDWTIGDKTGSGDFGTANDIGVVWPPRQAPSIVAIYSTQNMKDAAPRNDVIAAAARIVVSWHNNL